MNRAGKLFVVALSLGLGRGIHAADATANRESSQTTDRTDENSIAAARKSFDTLNRSRTAIGDEHEAGAPRFPSFLTPQLSVVSQQGLDPAKSSTAQKSEKNWLVDGALAKSLRGLKDRSQADSRQQGSGPSTESDGADGLDHQNLLARDSRLSREDGGSASTAREGGRETSGAALYNPLARYMHGWISPQDRALLLSPINPSNGPGASAAAGTNGSPDSTSGSLIPSRSLPEVAGSNAVVPSTATRENPYLNVGDSVAPNSAALVQPPIPQNFTPLISKRAEMAPSGPIVGDSAGKADKGRLRDLGRSDQDAKYFKQLNRF